MITMSEISGSRDPELTDRQKELVNAVEKIIGGKLDLVEDIRSAKYFVIRIPNELYRTDMGKLFKLIELVTVTAGHDGDGDLVLELKFKCQ